MARKFPISSVNRISEINLTSMMDMTFLLLITFIITFPLMEQGVPVNLPRGLADDLKPEDAITLSLDARARVYLNDSPITLEQLARRMQDLGRRDPDATVRVRDLDFGEEEEFTLVGDGEVDCDRGHILVTSPLGQGLLGHKAGERVEIAVPRGTLRFEILEIRYEQ